LDARHDLVGITFDTPSACHAYRRFLTRDSRKLNSRADVVFRPEQGFRSANERFYSAP
jgi:hypothetical protein